MSKYGISKLINPQWSDGLAFDSIQGRLLMLTDKLQILNSSELCDKDSPFDPNQLSNYNCLTILNGGDEYLLGMMKEKENQKIFGLMTKQGMSYTPDEAMNGKPLRKIDFSSCPDIQETISYALSKRSKVLWYATKDCIYSVYFETNNLIITPEYHVNTGDIITGMILWDSNQGKTDYTNPVPGTSDPIKSTNASERMLVISTLNGNQGTIRTIAVANLLRGTLEQNKAIHGEYSGFGKITAMTPHI